MKKTVLFLLLCSAAFGLRAQSCDSILLAYFKYDTDRIESYPKHKRNFFCALAQSAFYVTDNIPADAPVFQITEVQHLFTGESLPSDYIVNLDELNYYAYNFMSFQLKFPTGRTTICFYTPSSTHKYLVLRAYDDMLGLADEKLSQGLYGDDEDD